MKAAAAFLLTLALKPSHATNQLDIVPYPKEVVLGTNSIKLSPQEFEIALAECHGDCDLLQSAIDRYEKLIFPTVGSTETVYRLSIFEDRINAPVPNTAVAQLTKLNVVTSATVSALPPSPSSHIFFIRLARVLCHYSSVSMRATRSIFLTTAVMRL
jgi:hypothetical protein